MFELLKKAKSKVINVNDIDDLIGKIKLIDIREDYEKKDINEIPKDRPVYLHCRTGQRSYNEVLALKNLGFNNVYNITGSFLGLSFYEYFNDKRTDRERIVTAYNFR